MGPGFVMNCCDQWKGYWSSCLQDRSKANNAKAEDDFDSDYAQFDHEEISLQKTGWCRLIQGTVIYGLAAGIPVALRILNLHSSINTIASSAIGFVPFSILSAGLEDLPLAKVRKAVVPYLIALSVVFSNIWATYDNPDVQEACIEALLIFGGSILSFVTTYIWKKGALTESVGGSVAVDDRKLCTPDSTAKRTSEITFCGISAIFFGVISRLESGSLLKNFYPALSAFAGAQFIGRSLMELLAYKQNKGTILRGVERFLPGIAYILSLAGFAFLPFPSRSQTEQERRWELVGMGALLGVSYALTSRLMQRIVEETPIKSIDNFFEIKPSEDCGKIRRIARQVFRHSPFVIAAIAVPIWQEITLAGPEKEKSRIIYTGYFAGALFSYLSRLVVEHRWSIDKVQPLTSRALRWLMFNKDCLPIGALEFYVMFENAVSMDSETINKTSDKIYLICCFGAWFCYGLRTSFEMGAQVSKFYGDPLRDLTQALFNYVKMSVAIFAGGVK